MENITSIKAKRLPLWKWSLLLICGVVSFLFIYVLSQSIGALSSLMPVKYLLIFLAALAILGLYALAVRIFKKEWPSDLSMKKAPVETIKGLALGCGYFVVVTGIMAVSGVYSASFTTVDWQNIVLSFIFYFLIACGEEVIFRGILFKMIDERFNTCAALVISALVFGFIHLVSPNSSIWSSVAISVEAGLLLGAAYKYSGTLWFPIGIHWAWNFTQGNVFGFSVSGHSEDPSILSPFVEGHDLITGGLFGPEASIISVLLGLILSVIFIWQIYKNQRMALTLTI